VKDENQNQVLAVGAMVLLLVAVLMVGGGTAGGGGGSVREPAAAPLAAIESGADHIGAAELAARILAGGEGMLLVDVRPPAEFATFRLPRAVNLGVPELLATSLREQLAGYELVVLYSNGIAHPAQAWLELTRAGLRNVRVLDGGLTQFVADVLTPASLREGGDEATAKAEAARMALMRAFFLTPIEPLAVPLPWAKDPAQLAEPTVVSPAWLAARLGKVKVLDTRPSASDHAAFHVPGAVHFPEKPLRLQHGDRALLLAPAEAIAAALGAAGVGNDDEVVLLADDKPQDATLLAMALLRVGHQRFAILEGGILRWAAEQRPLVAGSVAPQPVAYVPKPGADTFTIDAAELHASLANGQKVLDVRPVEFFTGAKSTEARPGHIPGAVNRDYKKDLVRTDDGHYWRPPAELAKEYEALGLGKDDAIAVSCRTGHTASESYFVLRFLLGYRNLRWYNGSWTDWAERSELPAALGDGR
jgi:thiosulfate/3-mercaptopyruvate sulfurtransferase